MQTKSQWPWDIKLFLILIPLINLINYYLTYTNITLSWHTVIAFCIDTLEGFAAWLIVRYIIFYLDKKMPFEQSPVKRILLQIIATLGAGLAIIIILTELVNKIATNKPVPWEFYTTDIFIIAIWFFVVNGIYMGVYLYAEWQQSKSTKKHEEKIMNERRKLLLNGFMVKTGKTELLVAYEDIAGFFTEGEYVICNTLSEKKYLLDHSIDKIEKELPSILFFRLNRQYLVHRQMVTGFQRVENGKLNVLIKSSKNISSPISVSRTKAPAFKTWFQPEAEEFSA